MHACVTMCGSPRCNEALTGVSAPATCRRLVRNALAVGLMIFSSLTVQAASDVVLPDATPLFAATLTDLHQQPYALQNLRGKPLIVNFWARWCGPCRVEIPELVALHRQAAGTDLTVVGIGIESQVETVREFARTYHMEYTVLLGSEQGLPLLRALGNPAAALPYTLVIDRQGRVVARKLGAMKRSELDAALLLLH